MMIACTQMFFYTSHKLCTVFCEPLIFSFTFGMYWWMLLQASVKIADIAMTNLYMVLITTIMGQRQPLCNTDRTGLTIKSTIIFKKPTMITCTMSVRMKLTVSVATITEMLVAWCSTLGSASLPCE